jgi:lipopolysaccharide export system permease protein
MIRLTRYILSEFLKPLIVSSVAFGGLVLLSEFFRELSFYMENRTPFSIVFQYLLLNMPWWIVQVLPVAVLLAVLFSIGNLAKTGEITAMKAAGINLWKIFFILFSCGIAIGLFEAVLRETVIPLTVQNAIRLRSDKIRKEKPPDKTDFYELVISLPGEARMTIGHLNARQNFAENVVVDYYNNDFRLVKQLIAARAEWHNGWSFLNCVVRYFNNGEWTETQVAQFPIDLPFSPSDFLFEINRPEQMTTPDFYAYIRRLQTLGIPTEKERLQLNTRFSSIFSHLIVMMIGIPFAIGFGSRHGKMLSFTFALMFAFMYWSLEAVGQSLSENKIIPVVAAAWLGNFVFGICGVFLVSKIRK